jgi:hypothetical protein
VRQFLDTDVYNAYFRDIEGAVHSNPATAVHAMLNGDQGKRNSKYIGENITSMGGNNTTTGHDEFAINVDAKGMGANDEEISRSGNLDNAIQSGFSFEQLLTLTHQLKLG